MTTNNMTIMIMIILVIILLVLSLALIKKMHKVARLKPYFKTKKKVKIALFLTINDFISRILNYSEVMVKYGHQYDKYVVTGQYLKHGVNLLANKFIIAISFLLLALIGSKLELTDYELLIVIWIGYIVPDLVYSYRLHYYTKELNRSFYKSLLVLNDAYQSGANDYAALDKVIKASNERLKMEFKKVSLDLSYGLSLSEAYLRLYQRTNLAPAQALSQAYQTKHDSKVIVEVVMKAELTRFTEAQKHKVASHTFYLLLLITTLIPLYLIYYLYQVDHTYFKFLFINNYGFLIILSGMVLYSLYVYLLKKLIERA